MDHVASVSGSPHWGFLGSPPRSQITLGDWLHFLAESSFLSFSFFGPQEDMELSLSDFEYYGYDQNYTQFIFQSQLIYTKTNPGLVLPRYRDFGCDEGVF